MKLPVRSFSGIRVTAAKVGEVLLEETPQLGYQIVVHMLTGTGSKLAAERPMHPVNVANVLDRCAHDAIRPVRYRLDKAVMRQFEQSFPDGHRADPDHV